MNRRAQVPSATEPLGVDQKVGQNIRAQRKARLLSLEAVAASTGLSIGFISQLERGISSPTLRALTAMADALGLGVADLIVGPGTSAKVSPVIARASLRKGVTLWRSGIRKQVLAGGGAADGAPYSFSLLEFDLGAGSGEEAYAHRGEEAGYVLRGRLRLFVADQTWTLGPGDSFHFASHQPHRFENLARGRTAVVMINVHRMQV